MPLYEVVWLQLVWVDGWVGCGVGTGGWWWSVGALGVCGWVLLVLCVGVGVVVVPVSGCVLVVLGGVLNA